MPRLLGRNLRLLLAVASNQPAHHVRNLEQVFGEPQTARSLELLKARGFVMMQGSWVRLTATGHELAERLKQGGELPPEARLDGAAGQPSAENIGALVVTYGGCGEYLFTLTPDAADKFGRALIERADRARAIETAIGSTPQ